MKISKYLTCMLKDFFMAYGCLAIIASIFLGIYSLETMRSALLWQLILIAAAYTLFKFAFANKYELPKKAQLVNFTLCSILASIMVVLWLFLFSPSKMMDKSLLLMYVSVILVVKGAVYAMMYADGHKQAKQLNEKLNEYRETAEADTFFNS